MLAKFNSIVREINYSIAIKNRLKQIPIVQEIERIQKNTRYRDQKSLIPFGNKIYSQSDEDGIIQEIFKRIDVKHKTFVEFGIGNGLENNTLALLFNDWHGLWIDARHQSIRQIREHFAAIIDKGNLKVVESFITKENINNLIARNIAEDEIDLLSVDIDGNDYHILDSITCVTPRVIVVEYNAKFAPPTLFCMDYDETHTWKKDDCFGASLKFLEVNLDKKGYCLVGCNVSGVNAFFVRKDLIADKFLTPFTAENHYEPARYYLSGYLSGHPAAYETLAKSLTMRSC